LIDPDIKEKNMNTKLLFEAAEIVEKGLYFDDFETQRLACENIVQMIKDINQDEAVYTPEYAYKIFQYFYNMNNKTDISAIIVGVKDIDIETFMFLIYAINFKNDLSILDKANEGFKQLAAVPDGITIYDKMFERWPRIGRFEDGEMIIIHNMLNIK